jgi:hypothetical protein
MVIPPPPPRPVFVSRNYGQPTQYDCEYVSFAHEPDPHYPSNIKSPA